MTYGDYYETEVFASLQNENGSHGAIGSALLVREVPVPEPSSIILMGFGLLGLGAFRGRAAK